MSPIDEQRTSGAAPDAFLALLLGARARLHRGEQLLLGDNGACDAADGETRTGDDTVLLAALGWIALHRRLAAWIEACLSEAETPESPTPRTPRGVDLLR